MKFSIALSALLVAGFMAATTKPASAIVYCQYVDYPVGCTVRAGVVLRPRPVARAVATPGVGRVGTPTNRGGPVDRAVEVKAALAKPRPYPGSTTKRVRRRGGVAYATGAIFSLCRRSIAHSGVHSGRMPNQIAGHGESARQFAHYPH